MLSSILEIDGEDVLKAVTQYTKALTLLNQYDHQTLDKPDGESPVYRITYDDCRMMVDSMEDTFKSDVFGVEKEAGKVEGIPLFIKVYSAGMFIHHWKRKQPISYTL